MNANNQEIASLTKYSSLLGQEKELIQGQGGNTSIKTKDEIIIKRSGTRLSEAESKDIFCSVSLQCDSRTSQRTDRSEARPSIELPLHIAMPHNAVIHTHCLNTIARTLTIEGRLSIANLLEGHRWTFVEYKRPGKELSYATKEALQRRPSDIVVLKNHGILIGAETIEEAYALQKSVQRKLRTEERLFPEPDTRRLLAIQHLNRDLKLPKSSCVHGLAMDKELLRNACKTCLFPDFEVFCGDHVIKTEHVLSLDPEKARRQAIVVPHVGVLVGDLFSKASEEMLEAHCKILLRCPEGAKVDALSRSSREALSTWDAEQYRAEMARREAA